jgi:hypothetical protein
LKEIDNLVLSDTLKASSFYDNSLYKKGVISFLEKQKNKPYVKISESGIDFDAMRELFCSFSKVDPDFKKEYASYNLYILQESLGLENQLNKLKLKFELFNYDFRIRELGWYNIDKYGESVSPIFFDLKCRTSENIIQYDAYLFSNEDNVCISLKLFRTEFYHTGTLYSKINIPTDCRDLRLIVLGLTSKNEIVADYRDINKNREIKEVFSLKKIDKKNIKELFNTRKPIQSRDHASLTPHWRGDVP